MSLAFVVTTLIIVVTPGTGILYTLAAGLSRGARTSVVAALGCTLRIIPPMLAAITGLATLLTASALAFQTLRCAGMAYLLYMAWRTLRHTGALPITEQAAPRSAARVIARGVLINVLNTKLTIFFFAYLPQFVSAHEPDAPLRMTELSAVFMLVTFVVFVGYGVGAAAAAARTPVSARPRVLTWMRRACAGAFVALGLRLALPER